MDTTKESNPKDVIGSKKVGLHYVPCTVMMEVGLALTEGACKYGAHNFRVAGVRSSVYYDALMRHTMAWWEGQDIDPDSGLHHVVKAISTLIVLRDAMINDMLTDDRPPSVPNQDWVKEYNKKAQDIINRYPEPVAPFLITS